MLCNHQCGLRSPTHTPRLPKVTPALLQIPVSQVRALKLPPVIASGLHQHSRWQVPGKRTRRSEDKDDRKLGLRRSCISYIYAKQIDQEVTASSKQFARSKLSQSRQEAIIKPGKGS